MVQNVNNRIKIMLFRWPSSAQRDYLVPDIAIWIPGMAWYWVITVPCHSPKFEWLFVAVGPGLLTEVPELNRPFPFPGHQLRVWPRQGPDRWLRRLQQPRPLRTRPTLLQLDLVDKIKFTIITYDPSKALDNFICINNVIVPAVVAEWSKSLIIALKCK